MGKSPDIANPQSFLAKHGPSLAALVAISVLLGGGLAVLDSMFERKAHAQASYAAIETAVAANKAECELRMETSMGKIRIEIEQTRGSVARLEGNVARIDSTLQRVADKLGVAPVLPGFAPLAAPPKIP